MQGRTMRINVNKVAERVILAESEALIRLANNLPMHFTKIIEQILQTKGRVIVSGIGKSGHIGRKIAATLASTGTPAFFVHATEASHGDLGMISKDDFCLVISNSGETQELRDIVGHARRFGVALAVISSVEESTLVQNADFKLVLPTMPEACAIGMAPTTSTTLTLALGDALAVALMEHRDFKPEDFKIFHPGGKLGSQLASVDQLMRPQNEMAIVDESASMREIILRMTESGYGIAVMVNDDGKILGVISDGDLRRNADDLFNQDPMEVLTQKPAFVAPNDLIASAIRKMEDKKVYSILVIDHSRPIGLLRMHDLLRAGFI
jgi:arabinose-5-phosphate isomerase